MASTFARPRSAMGYINTETQFAGDILQPGIRDRLEEFYDNASAEDKARCLELLTSLDIGQAARDPSNFRLTTSKRPRSAVMGSKVAQSRMPRQRNYLQTTYTREYSNPDGLAAAADRPRTMGGVQPSYHPSQPTGISTYNTDYISEDPIENDIGPVSSRNNPHPLGTFMNWRLPPMKSSKNFYRSSITGMDEDMFDKVCRGQLASTYQSDYLGIPQGFQGIKHAFSTPEDWRSKVPYTLDTFSRYVYQKPKQERVLKGNVTRWGCNKKKHIPAETIVPTVSSDCVQNHIKSRTTYDREYTVPSSHIQEARDLSRSLGHRTMQGYVDKAKAEDEKFLQRMLKTMDNSRRTVKFHE